MNEQRRANKGGETGKNGEFYKGGTFIAETDAPKSKSKKSTKKREIAPYKWEVQPTEDSRSIYDEVSTFCKFDGETTYSKETGTNGTLLLLENLLLDFAEGMEWRGTPEQWLEKHIALVGLWNNGERWYVRS